MARRFGTSFQQNCTPNGFQASPWSRDGAIFTGAAGGIHVIGEAARLYLAPYAYSEVRKVVFWACIRHEYTDPEVQIPIRLRVYPSSDSQSAINLESAVLTSSSMNNTVGGVGSVWTEVRPNAEGALYGAQTSEENRIDTIRFPAFATQGSQLIYREFDRFDASAAAFYNHWDSVAANDNKDEHIAYGVGIQRTDGVDWINVGNTSQRTPIVVSCGFAIVQAPSPNNKTRLYLPGTQANYTPGAIGVAYGGGRGCHFYYHEDEWSGDFEIRHVLRQEPGAGPTGWFESEIGTVQQSDPNVTQLFIEQFGVGSSAGDVWFARSQEFASQITDGDVLEMRQRSLSGGNQLPTFGHWEITVSNFNVMTSYFSCGHPPPTSAQIPEIAASGIFWDQNSCLFDPFWFEDFEDVRIIETRMQGGLLHLGGGANGPVQVLGINSQLDEDVSDSLFNSIAEPELSATPIGSNGFKLRDDELTTEDPINLAGRRKFTERYSGVWNPAGTQEFPGTMNFAYVLNVPNTDVVDLGPLFDVGAFNSEGCAATSAGLGDPGLLIITNGSTIPQKFNPIAAGTPGEIEDAGIPAPFEGEVPSTATVDTAASPDGGVGIGIYKYRYTFRNCCTGKESDPSLDDIEVDTTGNSPAALVTLSFAGVRIPGDPQLCEICVYRTLEGGDFPIMAKIGCLTIDDTPTIVDDMSDAALDFTNEGISILNGPMPCVPVVIDFRNRLFGMGDIPNLVPAGAVSAVNGSDIITGDFDVLWDRCLEGRFIKIAGDCRFYEVLRVLPPVAGTSPSIQRLKLTEEYEGTTDNDLSYIICGRPNRLYFSEPLEPECWPAANFLDVEPGDGDRLMGGASNFDSLVICKRRKTYVLRFTTNPGTEVIVPNRISSDIGCVGPRTFAQVESGTVWLAERGLALFDGRSVSHLPESEAMNEIFTTPSNPNYVRRDRNGRVIDAVGVFYPAREQYLLILPTVKTERGCSLMLVWDVKLKNVTLLEFCQEFQSMVVAKDSDGNERVYIGDTNGFVWIYDIGDTDGVGFPNATGTVRGDITFAGVDEETGASVLDSAGASFITGGIPSIADLSGVAGLSGALGGSEVGLAGVCVHFRRKDVDYEEPWQSRVIYAATSTRLYVTPQWGPDTPFDPTGTHEYEFMIGAIEFDQLFKPQNYAVDDTQKRNWYHILSHRIEQFSSKLRVDLLPNFSLVDDEADAQVDPVTQEVGEGRIFRMDHPKGRQRHPTGKRVYDYMAVRMRNFAPEEPVSVLNHSLLVTPRASK